MKFGTANFSRCGSYRYLLTRSDDPTFPDPAVTFVMLNPAKADANNNDQTIGKCIGFAERWGMRTLRVVNLLAYCSSYQDELFAAADPLGPNNQKWLRDTLKQSTLVVCAWGKTAPSERIDAFSKLVKKNEIELHCIGTNLDGSPKHPARLGYAGKPLPFTLSG